MPLWFPGKYKEIDFKNKLIRLLFRIKNIFDPISAKQLLGYNISALMSALEEQVLCEHTF